MAEPQRRQMGPVALEDRLLYKKELKLLEPFRVELALAAITRDDRRMKLRSTFTREPDAALVAVIESVVMWPDLAAREAVTAPDELKAAWFGLGRRDDFEWYE